MSSKLTKIPLVNKLLLIPVLITPGRCMRDLERWLMMMMGPRKPQLHSSNSNPISEAPSKNKKCRPVVGWTLNFVECAGNSNSVKSYQNLKIITIYI
jgi:hypothetical protein